MSANYPLVIKESLEHLTEWKWLYGPGRRLDGEKSLSAGRAFLRVCRGFQLARTRSSFKKPRPTVNVSPPTFAHLQFIHCHNFNFFCGSKLRQWILQRPLNYLFVWQYVYQTSEQEVLSVEISNQMVVAFWRETFEGLLQGE